MKAFKYFVFFCALWSYGILNAQLNTNFTTIYYQDAVSQAMNFNNGIYTLTSDVVRKNNGEEGAIWNNVKVDLSAPFTITATLNFGTKDIDGADGICLIIQNDPNGLNAIGGVGEYIGYRSPDIANSLVAEFDTYQDSPPFTRYSR